MSNFPLFNYRALDANGDPISGAKLYFYTAGTTTPLATYSDRALSSANANPVVADGDGWFGIIYMQASAYKVRLTDADDNVIQEEDDIYGLSGALLESRVSQIALTPLDYGAVGDGVADESSEVQSALDNASGVVDLVGKTFRCDSQIVVPAGVTLRFSGGTLDFSNRPSSSGSGHLLVQGSAGTPTTANVVTAGDQRFSVGDSSGLSKGDWCLVQSDQAWDGGGDTRGEMMKVGAIVSGTEIDVEQYPITHYTTAQNATLTPQEMSEDVTIEGGAIVGTLSASGDGIEVLRGANVRIRDMRLENIRDKGITVRRSVNVYIENVEVNTLETTGYGVVIEDGSRDCHVRNLSTFGGYSVKLGNSTGGADSMTLGCSVSGLRGSSDVWSTFLALPSAVDFRLDNVSLTNGGLTLNGYLGSVSNASVLGGNVSIGDFDTSAIDAAAHQLSNITIHTGDFSAEASAQINGLQIVHDGVISLTAASGDVVDIQISNLKTPGDSNDGIIGAGSGELRLKIDNAEIEVSGSADGIGGAFDSLRIANSKISASTGRAVNCTVGEDSFFTGSYFSSNSSQTVAVQRTGSGANLTLAGCSIVSTVDTAAPAAIFADITYGIITGCYVSRTGDTDACVELSGGNWVINGCLMVNGDYAINSAASSLIADGSHFAGQSTGHITGTGTAGDIT